MGGIRKRSIDRYGNSKGRIDQDYSGKRREEFPQNTDFPVPEKGERHERPLSRMRDVPRGRRREALRIMFRIGQPHTRRRMARIRRRSRLVRGTRDQREERRSAP